MNLSDITISRWGPSHISHVCIQKNKKEYVDSQC